MRNDAPVRVLVDRKPDLERKSEKEQPRFALLLEHHVVALARQDPAHAHSGDERRKMVVIGQYAPGLEQIAVDLGTRLDIQCPIMARSVDEDFRRLRRSRQKERRQ
ncbi:hypothetical protein D3C83_22220 [compost metagenome]